MADILFGVHQTTLRAPQRGVDMWASRVPRLGLFVVTLTATLLLLVACGGGGNQAPPAAKPDFSITASPMTLTAAPGGITTTQVSLQPAGGFSGQATVSISGLPTGVTVSPVSPFPLTSAGQVLTINFDSSVAVGNYSITLQATAGNLSHSVTVSLQVESLAGFSIALNVAGPVFLTVGTSFTTNVGTGFSGNGATNYELQLTVSGLPAGVTASFANNPISAGGNTGLTISAAANAATSLNTTVTIVATRTLDQSQQKASFVLNVVPPAGNLANNRTAFVRTDGTPSSAVYDPTHQLAFASVPSMNRVDVISAATAQIIKSVPVPSPQSLDITLDDSQVIVGTNIQLLCFIDTSTLQVVRQALVNAPANSYSPFLTPASPLMVANGNILMQGVAFGIYEWNPATNAISVISNNALHVQDIWTRSNDGTKVLISNDTTPGSLILYNSTSDSFTNTVQFNDAPFALAANPNGTQFVAAVELEATYVLDANLNILGTLPVGGAILGIRYSLDGGSIYVVAQPGGLGTIPIIYTINATTLQIVGTAPAYASSIAYFSVEPQQFTVEVPLAVDDTGLIVGAGNHGIVLDDSTYFQSFSASVSYPSHTIVVDPAEGPLSASTPVTIQTDAYPVAPAVWFGAQEATNSSLNGSGQVQATAPPLSTSGPVNVKVIQPIGVVSYIPQGFTYGELPLPYATLAAAPAGGVTADLFGYGFSVDAAAPNLQVTISNQPAAITTQTLYPTEEPYPFPLQHLKVTVPAGNPGAQGITINSSSGTASIPHGFHYATSVTDYPSTAQFQDILYDQQRQQLYLTTQGQVNVFSLTSNAFLPPFVPPKLQGGTQLAGMALTPDSSQLVVANYTDQSVAIINPDNPSSAQAVAVNVSPFSIATTSTNQAFIVTPGGQLVDLDLATHQVTPVTLPTGVALYSNGSTASSSQDGTKVFIASYNGPVLVWDASSDAWQYGRPIYSPNDGASAGDGNLFVAMGQSPMVINPQAAVVGLGQVPDYLSSPGQLEFGIKVHDSGSLAYVPYQHGIDIYDAYHGDLQERVLLSETLSGPLNGLWVYTLAIDETGGRIFLITSSGLTVVQLDAVPLAIGSVTPQAGSASGGAQLTIRGSGFVSGAAVTIGGVAAATTFVDSDTLQVVAPPLSAGAVAMAVQNPDGTTYTLDGAYTAQ